MPTRNAMLIAGVDPDEQPAARHPCYVCGEPMTGLAARDMPTPEAARKQVKLGDRHRDCEPSEDAGSSRKIFLGVG